MADEGYLLYCRACGALVLPARGSWSPEKAEIIKCKACAPRQSTSHLKPVLRSNSASSAARRPIPADPPALISLSKTRSAVSPVIIAAGVFVLTMMLGILFLSLSTPKPVATAEKPGVKPLALPVTPIKSQTVEIPPMVTPVSTSDPSPVANASESDKPIPTTQTSVEPAISTIPVSTATPSAILPETIVLKLETPASATTTTATPVNQASVLASTPAMLNSIPRLVPVNPAKSAYAELPLTTILTDIKNGAYLRSSSVVEKIENPSSALLLEGLKALVAAREIRLEKLKSMLGKDIRLDTTKGVQNGKLISFENDQFQLERVIFINGETRGTSQATVLLADVIPTSLDRLVPNPAPIQPAEWLGTALSQLAGAQWENAEASISKLDDPGLKEALLNALKTNRMSEMDAQAKETWSKLESKASSISSTARAKQFNEELVAFTKKFGSTVFASAPDMAGKVAELKAQMDRLATGLDPRLLSLFHGRVLNYDSRTQLITLGYDFQTREQCDDFIGSIWTKPPDANGLTWKKGELKTFTYNAEDKLLLMPQFLSGTLNIQMEYKKAAGTWGNVAFQLGLWGANSSGKSPKFTFLGHTQGSSITGEGEKKIPGEESLFKAAGLLEVISLPQAFQLKMNGKILYEQALSKPNDHTGFWIGGGHDSGLTITRLQVSGRLDPAWVAKALELAKK